MPSPRCGFCFEAAYQRPKINHFRIHKNCYFPVKFVISLIIFVRDCRSIRCISFIKVTLAHPYLFVLISRTTILYINYLDILQFQLYFIPQAELEESFIYI